MSSFFDMDTYREQLRTAVESLISDGEVSADEFVNVFLEHLSDMKKYHQSIIDKIDAVEEQLSSSEGKKLVISSNETGYSIDYDPLDMTSLGDDKL